MIDLLEEGRRLWQSLEPPVAELAELAEDAQLRGSDMAEAWRSNGGDLPSVTNPPPIRHPAATDEPHGRGKSATSANSAPAHEIERIIDILEVEEKCDLGSGLKDLMRRTMEPLNQQTRATLAAEIDDVFKHATSIRQAREQADHAIRGKVGDPPPASVADWLGWIEDRCPINAEDRRYIANRIQHLPLAKMATICRWYAQTWAKAAAEEPSSHRKDNAGRRAANAALLTRRAVQPVTSLPA